MQIREEETMRTSLAVVASTLNAICLLPLPAAAADVFTPFEMPASATISPFRFEAGVRYWYSKGDLKFGFANGHPLFGSPTSTLDWDATPAHSGELFARIDHRSTGLFAKGVLGGGSIKGGEMIDRDFLVNQVSFSDTTSSVNDGSLRYGIIDAGISYDIPNAPLRIGVFGGYHYWTSKMNAHGVRCNPDNLGNLLCGPAGATVVSFDTPVIIYEATWHAARIGIDAKMMITSSLSLSGEAAWIPYATLNNKDSHLLRQSPADLGPAPNIITSSSHGNGVAAELFLNWHVMKHLEVGVGVRYWEFSTNESTVRAGPNFSTEFAGTDFIDQRYGVLLHVKGKI
jgi:hypothetical protein